jgi:hypothetical protein
VLIDTHRGKAHRRLLAVLLAGLAVATLVAACSSGDGDDANDAKKAATTTTTAGKNACDLLDRKDLSEVTGLEFDDAQPSDNNCIYTSTEGLAAISLTFTELEEGITPDRAIAESTSTCDAGTSSLVSFPRAQGGFRCTVKGVATVGATGDGVFAVLTAATLREDVPTTRILEDLVTILEHALTRS